MVTFVLGEIREIIVISKTIRRAFYYYGKNGCNFVKTQATAHGRRSRIAASSNRSMSELSTGLVANVKRRS